MQRKNFPRKFFTLTTGFQRQLRRFTRSFRWEALVGAGAAERRARQRRRPPPQSLRALRSAARLPPPWRRLRLLLQRWLLVLLRHRLLGRGGWQAPQQTRQWERTCFCAAYRRQKESKLSSSVSKKGTCPCETSQIGCGNVQLKFFFCSAGTDLFKALQTAKRPIEASPESWSRKNNAGRVWPSIKSSCPELHVSRTQQLYFVCKMWGLISRWEPISRTQVNLFCCCSEPTKHWTKYLPDCSSRCPEICFRTNSKRESRVIARGNLFTWEAVQSSWLRWTFAANWTKFRKWLKVFVDGKIFQRGILLAILVNTLSMGIEYHNQVSRGRRGGKCAPRANLSSMETCRQTRKDGWLIAWQKSYFWNMRNLFLKGKRLLQWEIFSYPTLGLKLAPNKLADSETLYQIPSARVSPKSTQTRDWNVLKTSPQHEM